MKQYFLPRTDNGKSAWLNNFSSKLTRYAAKYNLSAAEIADMIACAAFFVWVVQMQESIKRFKESFTSYKEEAKNGIAAGASASVMPEAPDMSTAPTAVQPGIFNRATSIGNRIKEHTAYTIADGEDLGLEGAESFDEEPPVTPIP